MKIKKQNHKKVCHKKKFKLQDHKNCLEAAQIERKIKYLRKKKTDVDNLTADKKEFVKNNKLILKTQRRLKSERYNVFTEEIKKIAVSSNVDKRM